jgi:hypothetical protein
MANDLWETPQYIFDWLDKEFHFELDTVLHEGGVIINDGKNDKTNTANITKRSDKEMVCSN